jgi:hypothetical protein
MYGTRRIPPDIIRDIFSHLSSPLKVHEAHKFPWYLGQICSDWRAAFLSMQPHFWSEVEIEKPPAHKGGKKQLQVARTMEILTFFLDMTRGAPFSFTLYALQLEPLIKKKVPYVQTILSKFLDYSAQWKNVVMEVRLSQLALLRDIKNQVPMLQILTLMMPGRVPSDYGEDILSGDDPDSVLRRELGELFEDAPHLTGVQLDSICSVAWRFNWASLTSIHLASTDGTKEIISTLRQTVNLERFSVYEIFYPSYLNPADFEIVKLPRLKYLSVYGVLLLTILEAPALKELRITFEEECAAEDEPEDSLDDSEVAGRINAFLVRSKCKLSKFCALSLKSPVVLNHIFPHMPDVQELYIEAMYMPYISEVFECLQGGSESSTQAIRPTELPLSHLNVLTIFSFFEDGDLKPVNEMMARRNPTAGTIDAGPKELKLILNGVARYVTTELESLESMCKDRGIRFTFDCWEPGMFFVIG